MGTLTLSVNRPDDEVRARKCYCLLTRYFIKIDYFLTELILSKIWKNDNIVVANSVIICLFHTIKWFNIINIGKDLINCRIFFVSR